MDIQTEKMEREVSMIRIINFIGECISAAAAAIACVFVGLFLIVKSVL